MALQLLNYSFSQVQWRQIGSEHFISKAITKPFHQDRSRIA